MTEPGPGRPRKNTPLRRGNGTYEEIADAAAELFSKHGFAGTSLVQIANAVGVGQGSIYHHFGSKQGILAALLIEGIRPGLRIAEFLAADSDSTDTGVAARLYTLALADATVLASWRWNSGALLLLPEARSPLLTDFQEARLMLRNHYVRMSRELTCRTGSEDVEDLVLRLVVSIINQRWDDQTTSETPPKLARSGLRMCGWTLPMDQIEHKAGLLLQSLLALGVELPTRDSASIDHV
jgi:AcrR family transcriptional regulator